VAAALKSARWSSLGVGVCIPQSTGHTALLDRAGGCCRVGAAPHLNGLGKKSQSLATITGFVPARYLVSRVCDTIAQWAFGEEFWDRWSRW